MERDDDFGPLPTGATPRILREAIRLGLCVGSLSGIEDRMYWLVRDFLAQRFGAKMLDPALTADTVNAIEDLFKEIVVDWKFAGGGPNDPKKEKKS